MSGDTVRTSISKYQSQSKSKGLLYDSQSCPDMQSKKALNKKTDAIFGTFLKDCDYADEPVCSADMGPMIRSSLQEIVCAMKRKSGEEYKILNDYFDYLKHKYKIEIRHFDRQLTPLERQLSIAKDLHNFDQAREFDRHLVAEKYLVSDRTIDSDLAALHEGISVMDQRLVLEDFHLKNKKVTAVSTMHPLFLTQNLTQVVCMLEGLRKMEDNWTLRSYAENTAVSIWCQLSEYARDRILNTLVDLMHLDKEWYERICRAAEYHTGQMFYNEKEAGDRDSDLMYALKGGLKCLISYISSDETRKEILGRVTDLDKNGVKLLAEKGTPPIYIEKDSILEIEVATELR